jgi:hypothetical protein
MKPKECVHHYMIPEPCGTNEVLGVCKKCGDEKVHELVIPWKSWNPWRGDRKKAEEHKAMTAGAAVKKKRVYQDKYRNKYKKGNDATDK